MGKQVECLPCNPEDLSSIPEPVAKASYDKYTYNLRPEELETGGSWGSLASQTQ